MATTITISDLARCLAKRPLVETQGISSPPSSKRARGESDHDVGSSVVMPGEGDLISPPISTRATIPTVAAEPSSSASTAPVTGTDKQHPQLPSQMPHLLSSHLQQLQHRHMRLTPNYQARYAPKQLQTPTATQTTTHARKEECCDHDEDEYDDDAEDEEEDECEGKDPRGDWDTRSWNSGILPALPSGLSSAEVRAAREDEACGQSIEDTYKRTLSHFPDPSILFPAPTLEFDFRISVNLKPESTQVHGRCHKEITAVSSGSWSGSFGNGKITAGGYDLGQARGFRPIRIVEGAFVMQTSDEAPATLEMRTRGSLSGPCDVLDALLSCREPKQIDCRKYGFRMFLTVKTADKRYAEIVNSGLWVASGIWRGEQLLIDAYRVA